MNQPEPFDPTADPRFAMHVSECQMILQRAKISPRLDDPYYGYRNLAEYVMSGFREVPFDGDDTYLRVLAACKAETHIPLPSINHMQRLMSVLWDSEFPEGTKEMFERICASISTGLCNEVTNFTTISMKAIAASLHVALEVQWESETTLQMTASSESAKAEAERESTMKKNQKPLLH